MGRITIHLGVHNHPIVDGKCQEFVEKTRRLIAKEVDRMLNAKTFIIAFSVSKTFLANYLFPDSNDGVVEFLEGEHLEHIQDKFCELNSPNIHNLVASFKCHLGGGYIDSIIELKSKKRYDYI
jgi:hypothetical protein